MHLDNSLVPPDWRSRSILTDAIMGKRPSLRQLDKKVVKAFFYKHDSELASAAKADFQDLFNFISAKAQKEARPLELKEELFCYRLLSFFPFLKPEGESIDFPISYEGPVEIRTYRFERIELTDNKLVSPLVAYGLIAKEGAPILIFKGTTYPADDGFARSLLADFTPNSSVGGRVLKKASDSLKAWVSDKKGIIVTGISLGGSLAQHFGQEFSDRTTKIYAFSAPRLIRSELKEDSPPCIRVNTKGDIVTKVGDSLLPKTITYEIETDEKYNFLWRHILAPETHKSNKIKEKKSEECSIFSKLHKLFSPLIYAITSVAITAFLYFSSFVKSAVKLLTYKP